MAREILLLIRGFDEFCIVTLLLLWFSVACEMDMHIDQAGHDVFSLQIHLCVAGKSHLFRDNRCDFFSLSQNRKTGLNLHIFRSV